MTNEAWMRDLQEGYIRSLPGKIGEIRTLVDRVRATPSDPRGIHDLAHAVQRLVGSAGTYGFPAISGVLSPSARLLAQAEDGAAVLSERELSELLGQLEEAASLGTGPG